MTKDVFAGFFKKAIPVVGGVIGGGLIMGIFTDGDDEDDELFDLYMLNEIRKGSDTSGSTNHSGGCLTSFLLIMTVPIGIALGVCRFIRFRL